MANTKKSKASKKHGQQTNETKQRSSHSLQKTSESDRSQTNISRREQAASWPGSPFAFMRRFSEEMDRLFDDFGLGSRWLAPTVENSLEQIGALSSAAWSPQVEVFERDNQLVVRADLPGMTKNDIKVDISDNALVIRGERKSEREEDEQGYYRSERSYGSVYRRIPLPEGIDTEKATADFRNGVLEINLPAPQGAEQKRRQIEIRGGADGEERPQSKARAAGQKQ